MTTSTDRSSVQQESSPTLLSRTAITLSVAALAFSTVSLAVWTTSVSERQQVETRLACLELPGPNDCGVDGK